RLVRIMMSYLDDVFSDELFEDLTKQEKKKKIENLDPEIIKFQEIINFVKNENREPEKTKQWSEERALWARLQGFRDKKERSDKVKHIDELNLLNKQGDFLDELNLTDNRESVSNLDE